MGFLENPARKSMVLRPEIRTECLPSLDVCFKEKRRVKYKMFTMLQQKDQYLNLTGHHYGQIFRYFMIHPHEKIKNNI